MDWLHDWAGTIIAFFSGLIVALWRALSVVSKINLLEHRVNELEKDNDRLLNKLELIDNKIDKFILNNK